MTAPIDGRSPGFTIVELTVVIAILAVLFGLGIPFYQDFRLNQELEQARQTLKTNLRLAQSQAFGGVKPLDCTTTTLVGWYIRVQDAASSYQMYYRCGLGSEQKVANSYKSAILLPQEMTLSVSQSLDILFQPVNRATVFTTNAATQDPPVSVGNLIDITLTKRSKSVKVTVQSTGDIL